MFDVETRYLPRHEALKKIILKREKLPEAIALALELHALTHLGEISAAAEPTYEDLIWAGVEEADFAVRPGRRCFTLAWHIWHLTRIEDLVGNILIKDGPQIFNGQWAKKLKTDLKDTGNALTDPEVDAFSQQLNIGALREYRVAVGRRTREILQGLAPEGMRRKPTPASLDRLLAEGGLTEEKGSRWLLDFWGTKTIGGLVLLPLTRHHLMHLEACAELKSKIKGMKP